MSRFDEIASGLREAIECTKTGDILVRKLIAREVKSFTPEEIKDIRKKAQMTQGVFAACLGVSRKSIEAWEGGRSKPTGSACRLLELFENNPSFAEENGIFLREG